MKRNMSCIMSGVRLNRKVPKKAFGFCLAPSWCTAHGVKCTVFCQSFAGIFDLKLLHPGLNRQNVLWCFVNHHFSKFTMVFVRRKWYFLSCQADCINSNDQGVHSTESCRRDFFGMLERAMERQSGINLIMAARRPPFNVYLDLSLFVFFGESTTDNFGWRESHNSWFLAGTSTIWWYKVRWGRAKVVSSVDPD